MLCLYIVVNQRQMGLNIGWAGLPTKTGVDITEIPHTGVDITEIPHPHKK